MQAAAAAGKRSFQGLAHSRVALG